MSCSMTIRAYALDFLARATNGAKGVARGDAPYERVTEGRHTSSSYSACGDLGNALLYACGIRSSAYINRKENGSYRIGWNVATLDSLANSLREYPKNPIAAQDIVELKPGDITIVWNRSDTTDAHVSVVRAPVVSTPGEVRTSDYGQGAPLDGKQRQRGFKTTELVSGEQRAIHPLLGSRKLQRIINLEVAVAKFATEPPIPLDTYFGPVQTMTNIETLQTLLNNHGASPKLVVDGLFGPKTKAALKAFLGPKAWAVVEDKTK